MNLKPLIMIMSSLLLAGCAGYVDETPSTPNKEISNNTSRPSQTSKPAGDSTPDGPIGGETSSSEPEIEEDPTYTVFLTINGKQYVEDDLEDCRVVFYDLNTKQEFPVEFDKHGYAITDQLDGDYAIHLENCPSKYTYDPNIYFTDYVKKETEIKLIELVPLLGTGNTPYDDIYKMTKVGTYRYTITKRKRDDILYAQFEPKVPGVYSIETLCDIYADNIDPTVELYSGTAVWKNLDNPTVLNDGGNYRKGGYTKNIKYTVKIAKEFIGNVFAYGLRCTVKDGVYPVYIDFRITYLEDYVWEDIKAEEIVAEEANFKTPELSGAYTYANLGGLVFDGKNFVYGPDRFWHYKTADGPILCADIDTPSQFLDVALTHVEDSGNKNLTVSDATENYRKFITESYAAACNSAGRCYVTMELKEFLQKYSNSQLLFQDGNGFIEYETHHYAAEPDQWLWACGFYGVA